MSLTKAKFIAASRKRQWEKIEHHIDHHPNAAVASIYNVFACIDEVYGNREERLFHEDLITYRTLARYLGNYFHPDDIAKMCIDKNDTETLVYASGYAPAHLRKCSPELYEYAAKKGRVFVLKCILDANTYIETRDMLMKYKFVRNDDSPRDSIMIALQERDHKSIKKILNDHPELANEDDDFPICYACEYGDIETVKLLLACKDTNPGTNNDFPIKIAKIYGYHQIIMELLKHPGVSVDEIDLDIAKRIIKGNQVCIAERIFNEGNEHTNAYLKNDDIIRYMLKQNNDVALSAIRNQVIKGIPSNMKLASDVEKRIKREINRCTKDDRGKAYKCRSYQENVTY